MNNTNFTKYWKAFLHWNGWEGFASFWKKIGKIIISWAGWKFVFGLPGYWIMILCTACTLGLIWVFTQGLEQWIPAYFLYAVSAYALTALCVKLPGMVQSAKQWFARHPKITAAIGNQDRQFRLGLYMEQLLNFAYGSFKIGAGILYGSAWIGADGIYNLTLSLIQLFQILRRKNLGSIHRQWNSYRLCGVLILIMHLTLTGIVFQMVNWNRAEEQGEIMVIATAAFAFYKLTTSFLSIAKDRKHIHPVDSSVRMLNLAQAIFAIFSLQATMFHTFGAGENWEHMLNIITGSTVCLLVASMGVYMIRRGTREIKQLKEREHG